mmetsp:Transcript_6286/g.12891  ORF Transcript_6286/g.12891 Transcript_6286/m.12891 type:complete len:217 (+) Transcript_6286:967-1617(+)
MTTPGAGGGTTAGTFGPARPCSLMPLPACWHCCPLRGINIRMAFGLESGVLYVNKTSWSMRGRSLPLMAWNCRLMPMRRSMYVQSNLSSSSAFTKDQERSPYCFCVSFPSANAVICISSAVWSCPAAEKQKATGVDLDMEGRVGSLPLRGLSISIIGWKRGRAFTVFAFSSCQTSLLWDASCIFTVCPFKPQKLLYLSPLTNFPSKVPETSMMEVA